jgi:hypothetical protein
VRALLLRLLGSIVLGGLLVSCGSPVRRSEEYPLSDVVFRLRHGGVSGAIPAGWSAGGPAVSNGTGDSTAAMTLSGGDSLRIVFRQVTLDSAASAYFRKRSVAELAMLTRTLRDSTAGAVRKGIGTFKASGREFATYEVGTDGMKMKVAVFPAGEYYYECEAAAVRPLSSTHSFDLLFSAQEAVLRSLR